MIFSHLQVELSTPIDGSVQASLPPVPEQLQLLLHGLLLLRVYECAHLRAYHHGHDVVPLLDRLGLPQRSENRLVRRVKQVALRSVGLRVEQLVSLLVELRGQ